MGRRKNMVGLMGAMVWDSVVEGLVVGFVYFEESFYIVSLSRRSLKQKGI